MPALVATLGLAIVPALIAVVGAFGWQLGSAGRWVINVLTVTVSVGTLAVASYTALKDPAGTAPSGSEAAKMLRRRRWQVLAGALSVFAVLMLVFFGLRDPFATIPRMTGTEDVAIIGFIRPDGSTLEQSPDLSDALAEQLGPRLPQGTAKSYASLDAPLDGLLRPDDSGLAKWTSDFVTRSNAAIVVAGIIDDVTTSQIQIRPAIYVKPSLVPEAPTLMAWVVGPSAIVTGELASTRGRQSLFASFLGSGVALTHFVDALDAWRVGRVDDAVELFTKLPQNSTGGLLSGDLVHLFKGHALELQAQTLEGAQRGDMLATAAREYADIQPGSPLNGRAQVSTATNEYLRALGSRCSPETIDARLLGSALDHLRPLTINMDLPAISRLAALVNYAQAGHCALTAGLKVDEASISTALQAVKGFADGNEATLGAVHRIQALARSVEAQMAQEAGNEIYAETLIEQAIGLSPDPVDQGRWYGLKSIWQQQACHLPEARASLDLSLREYKAGVDAGRISAEFLTRYTDAAYASLATNTERCGK
jgi:hypothetical protein